MSITSRQIGSHEIVLEGITPMEHPATKSAGHSRTVLAQRACPPEKINGVVEYREFVNAIEDPSIRVARNAGTN